MTASKMIRLKPDIIERLKELRKFILRFGIDYITEDFEIENLTYNGLIKLLLDITGIV